MFVFITAKYETDGNPNVNNSVVIWDKIIKTKRKANLQLENEQAKYGLLDQGRNLRGNNVTFQISWNIIPYTGYLYAQDSPTTFSYVVPDKYKGKPVFSEDSDIDNDEWYDYKYS